MIEIMRALWWILGSRLESRERLEAENLALRHQLNGVRRAASRRVTPTSTFQHRAGHSQDTCHRQFGIVPNFFNGEDRARNTAEESEGRHMAVTEGLADLRQIALEKARIRVRRVHGKEMCLTLDPGNDYLGLAEVYLLVTLQYQKSAAQNDQPDVPEPPLVQAPHSPNIFDDGQNDSTTSRTDT